ncbi:MAG: hypothetical protein NTY53_19750 [Kiritimatiellaeota bacterium]|nr:hypothetical protein [Kiritimatiellota bacterium]
MGDEHEQQYLASFVHGLDRGGVGGDGAAARGPRRAAAKADLGQPAAP